MKYVKIQVVPEPKDFRTVRFSKADYDEAAKAGPKRVPYVTAREAIRNSGHMYVIVHDKPEVEVKIKGAKDPDEMSSAELVAEMTAFGKPPRKKMDRRVAVDFVRKLREEAAALIVDEDEEE